jgi:hypothetical protein
MAEYFDLLSNKAGSRGSWRTHSSTRHGGGGGDDGDDNIDKISHRQQTADSR